MAALAASSAVSQTANRRELAQRVAFAVVRYSDYAEGSAHATRIALDGFMRAQRDLSALIESVESRLYAIDPARRGDADTLSRL